MLPVTVIGGYLGAGKTTLVNHLLRHAGGRRLGVLVNEFGNLPIDADLIEGEAGGVLSIAGGCICCSYGDDLLAALMDFAGRGTLDQVVIECSGVALPGAVARMLALPGGLSLAGIVVLVDAEQVRAQVADRYIGDTITRQLADADLILLNKCDLVADAAEVAGFVAEHGAQGGPCVMVAHAAVPVAVVLGPEVSSRFDAERPLPFHDTAGFDAASFRPRGAVDTRAVAEALGGVGLVRAKGFLRDHDGGWRVVQVVGARVAVTAAPAEEAGPGRLVCIAHGGRVDRAAVGAVLV